MPDVWVLSAWEFDTNNAKVPSVVITYPSALGWSDMTYQLDTDILDGVDRSVVHGRIDNAQLTLLLSDPNFVVLAVGNPDTAPPYLPEQIESMKTLVAAQLSSDMAGYATLDTVSPAIITARIIEVNQYPVWRTGLVVSVGDVYYYEGNLFRVIQTHTTQSDWQPNIVPALFKRFYEPNGDPWPWVQPVGGHDAYPLGARVLHNTYTYVSLITTNVWEPGIVGSELLWECENCPQIEVWVIGVVYSVNDQVMHLGTLYSCLQAHTSIATWSPSSPGILGVLWATV